MMDPRDRLEDSVRVVTRLSRHIGIFVIKMNEVALPLVSLCPTVIEGGIKCV